MNNNLDKILKIYLENKPTFLAIIRAKEATIFNCLLPYKGKVLDFGCGDGFFTKTSLLDSNQKINVGLETDYKRAHMAEEKLIYQKVVLYNGKKIPFKNKEFSLVLSNSVLEHIKDIESSLREIYRILKKGGKFYVSVMVKDYEDNLLGTFFLSKLYKLWMKKRAYHENLLSKKEWEKLFFKTGFKLENKVGYLNRTNTQFLDLIQYLSIPTILTQKIFPFLSLSYCQMMKIVFYREIYKRITQEKKDSPYSSYFYILKK